MGTPHPAPEAARAAITATRLDEIVAYLNEMERQGANGCLNDSGDAWTYLTGLSEYDPDSIDHIDPAGTNARVRLRDGSMIYWCDQQRQWTRRLRP
jgi:hypothetical protein